MKNGKDETGIRNNTDPDFGADHRKYCNVVRKMRGKVTDVQASSFALRIFRASGAFLSVEQPHNRKKTNFFYFKA